MGLRVTLSAMTLTLTLGHSWPLFAGERLILLRLRLVFDFLIPDIINLIGPERFDPDNHVPDLLVCQFSLPGRHGAIHAAILNHFFQRFR